MDLYLTPCIPSVWTQYVQYMRLRGQNPPPVPAESIMICNGDGAFVAGTCVYVAGPYLMAEFAVSCPYAPLRARHKAFELAMDTFLAMASARGLAPLIFPNRKGLVLMLLKRGLVMQKAAVMTVEPRPTLLWSSSPSSRRGSVAVKTPPEVFEASRGRDRPVTNAEEVTVPRKRPSAKATDRGRNAR